MNRNNGLKGKLFLLSAALLWSTASACVKILPWSAFSIQCIRGLLCAVLVMVLERKRFFKEKRFPRPTRYSLGAALAMTTTSCLYMLAVKLTSAANAVVLQYIAPILILLYTLVIERKRPRPLDVVVTLTVFGGCVLAFADKLGGGGMLGNLLALASGFTWAAQMLISRNPKTCAEDGFFFGGLMSFVVTLPFLLTDSNLLITPVTLGVVAYLGIFQYGLGNFLFAKGIKLTESLPAALLLTLEPIVTPIWVFITLGELPGPLAILGFVLVVGAVTLHGIAPQLKRRV